MALYRAGTASLDDQGVATGTGTEWMKPLSLIRVGATIVFLSGDKPSFGVIAEILSDTSMRILSTDGEAVSDGPYVILVNDSLTVDGLAQDISEALRYYQGKETSIQEIIDMLQDTDLETQLTEMQQLRAQALESEQNAAESESMAKKWASDPVDQVVADGEYSAKHYATKATEQADEATAQATEATNQAHSSASSATESAGYAQDSLGHAEDSADSAAAAQIAQAGAEDAESRINQALDGTFKERGEIGQNGNPEDLDSMYLTGVNGHTGVWKQPTRDNALPENNYPVAAAGALYVNDTVASGVTQTYITIYGDVYVRTRVSGSWQSWSMVGAGFVNSDGADLDLITGAAQIVGSNLVNAPPDIGTSAAFVRVSAQHTGTNARQSVSAPGSNRHFERVKTASSWSDWLELATVKTNGITDVIRGFGNQITLPVDASNPNEAVTLKQMQAAISAVSSSGGINGVMSTFIGDVSWWIGTAANIPTAYVLPTGQLSLRSDYPEIWALIEAGVFRTTTEAQWNTSTATSRGFFTTGTVTSGANANFRWPDLNGGTTGSIGGIFLRGANGPTDAGGVGVTRASAAPNINGDLGSGSFKAFLGHKQISVNDGSGALRVTGAGDQLLGPGGDAYRFWQFKIDASLSNSAYGRDGATEVRPNSVSGYWIIRAKGTFSAQTSFGVFTSDDQLVASAVKLGGAVRSVYKAGGVDYGVRMESQVTTDANKNPKTVMKLSVEGGSGQATLDDSGQFSASARVGSRVIAMTSGAYEMNFTNMANGLVQINRTSNITQLNFGGVNVTDVLSYFGLGNMVTRGNFDTYVATGSLVGQNGPSLRSSIRDGGTQDGRVRANFDLFALCDNGGQRKGILRVHSDAFTQEYNWYFNGSGNYAGRIVGTAGIVAIEGSSDIKLKVIKSAVDLPGALDRINAFEMKEYYWNNHRFNKQRGVDINQLQRGVIAQQIEEINPAYVNTSQVRIGTAEDGYDEEIKTLDTNAILMDALASIQALSKQVKDLQAEVKALKGE